MGEHMTGSHEVRGSIPLSSTNKINELAGGCFRHIGGCDSFVTVAVLGGGQSIQEVDRFLFMPLG